MGGPVLVGAFELQHDIAGAIAFEPFIGNGGAESTLPADITP